MSERMSPEDTAFLHLEDEVTAMHHLTVAVFAGPEPSRAEVIERVAARIPLVPRFRQRIVEMPFGAQRPMWFDDAEFDLDYHVRNTGLPAQEPDALQHLVGRILSQRLDRGKPLWELWLVSNVSRKKWAVISKVHHAMIDGVSGNDPLTLIADSSRSRARRARDWQPEPIPSDGTLLLQAALDTATNPAEQIRVMRRAVRPVKSLTGRLIAARRQNPLSVVGAVGPHRRWNVADVPLPRLREMSEAHDATTNDVILALTTMGFRAMFKAVGAPVPPAIRAVVPYAVGSGKAFNNEMTALKADLPTGFNNVDAVINNIAAQTRNGDLPTGARSRKMAPSKGFAAPTLTALGLRTVARGGVSAGGVHTVIINAPSPADKISLLGRELLEVTPAIPLVAKVRISIGVMSYLDTVRFGVTGDRETAPELAAMVDGIESAARRR